MKMVSRWTIVKVVLSVLASLLLLTLFVVSLIPDSPTQELILSFLEWAQNLPKYISSLLIFVCSSTLVLVFIPMTPWNIACGYLFGIWLGSVVSLCSTSWGAIMAFLLGRFALRSWTVSLAKQKKILRALDKAIELQSFKLIFMTRLSPVMPFPLLNYFFGATRVKFTTYALATVLGLFPFTVAFTWLGSQLKELKDVVTSGFTETSQIIYIVASIVTTIIVVVIITIITRSAIKSSLGEVEEEEEQEQEEINKEEEKKKATETTPLLV